MFKADTHELLCLFATMVAADKKVYAVEIEAFSESVIELFNKTDLGPAPSEARLFMWFEINRENIRSKMTEDNFEDWFQTLMKRVSEVYSMKAVVEVMEKIARADDEVHISETALLVLVDRYRLRAA